MLTFDQARARAQAKWGWPTQADGLEDATDYVVGPIRDPMPIGDPVYFVTKRGRCWEGNYFDLQRKLSAMYPVASDSPDRN